MSGAVRFVWAGFEEQLAQFATLPEDLTASAAPDVEAATTEAAQHIRDAYPFRSGNLRDGVTTEITHEGDRVAGTVTNNSPHALYFEYGTQARHTAIGANRGSMPAHPLFIPEIMRRRRALMAGPLPAVLTGMGLQATGNG